MHAVQKSVVSKILKDVLLLSGNDAFNWSKVYSKDIYNVMKDFILNKCCSFELSIHHKILKIYMYHDLHKNMNQPNSFF